MHFKAFVDAGAKKNKIAKMKDMKTITAFQLANSNSLHFSSGTPGDPKCDFAVDWLGEPSCGDRLCVALTYK